MIAKRRLTKYRVTFDRIGVVAGPIAAELHCADDEDLLRQVMLFSNRRMVNPIANVTMSPESGKGHLDGGRYGHFTFEAQS